jgi:general stress protein 26
MADDRISNDTKDVHRVWELMQEIGTCMFITRDGDVIRARPMAGQPRETENAIYFLTDVTGHKDQDIADDAHVCLAFAHPGESKFLSVAGEARVLDDRPLIRALWNLAAQAWWEGPEDPKVRAIEVTPRDAQFWEGREALSTAVKLVAAATLGGRPDIGEQAKVDLH